MQVERVNDGSRSTSFGAKLSVINFNKNDSTGKEKLNKLFEKKTAHYPDLTLIHKSSRFTSKDVFMLADKSGNELVMGSYGFAKHNISTPEKQADKYVEIFESMVIKAIKAGKKINIKW